jgi:hypothetical protein
MGIFNPNVVPDVQEGATGTGKGIKESARGEGGGGALATGVFFQFGNEVFKEFIDTGIQKGGRPAAHKR